MMCQMKDHDKLVHLTPNLHCKHALVGRCWGYFDFHALLLKLPENPSNVNAAQSIQVQSDQISDPVIALI